jgi:hypothetical protein
MGVRPDAPTIETIVRATFYEIIKASRVKSVGVSGQDKKGRRTLRPDAEHF